MENQNMENEYERVILSQLIDRCHERLPLYDKKVVKEIIKVFLEELKDAIIHNACVVINGFFAFRHREVKERYTNGEDITEELLYEIVNNILYKAADWYANKWKRTVFGVGYLGCSDAEAMMNWKVAV